MGAAVTRPRARASETISASVGRNEQRIRARASSMPSMDA